MEEDIKIIKESYIMSTNHCLDENNAKLKKAIENLLADVEIAKKQLKENCNIADERNQLLMENKKLKDKYSLEKLAKEEVEELLEDII